MAHRKRTPYPAAFTVVELLIVIVVIGILATLTIIGYHGVREAAIESTVEYDLSNAAKLVEQAYVEDGDYASSASEVNDGEALPSGDDTELTYYARFRGYCILGTNTGTSTTYNYKSADGVVTEGDCSVDPEVITYAGSGEDNVLDGTSSVATFNHPTDVASDADGLTYVADPSGGRIRIINKNGTVTSQASDVTLYPYAIALDSSGNMYTTNDSTGRVYKTTPGGTTTLLAGSSSGYADGTGSAAQFSAPAGIVVADDGTVYVADTLNHRIRSITAAGVVTTLAGSGTAGYTDATGTSAEFNRPSGITISSTGDLYVADMYNHVIRKVTTAGVVTTLAGSGSYGFTDGNGTSAQFDWPRGIDIDSNDLLYVAERYNHAIRSVSLSGDVTTVAGTGSYGFNDALGTAAAFDQPYGLDVNEALHIVSVADYYNRRIRVISVE